jgi:phospholipid transport system substrate-binding protein
MRLLGLLLLGLLSLVLAPGSAQAEGGGPGIARVRSVNDAVVALLRQSPAAGSPEEKRVSAKISETVGAFLDIEALGRSALVDHWAKLSPPQRKEFSKLLAELVEGSYVRALRSNLDYEVKYISEEPKGADRFVQTEVRADRKGRPQVIAVDYVLRESGGSLRAVDVVTDGVGIVENYRAQFNKIIAQEGFSGLIGRMRKKATAGEPS